MFFIARTQGAIKAQRRVAVKTGISARSPAINRNWKKMTKRARERRTKANEGRADAGGAFLKPDMAGIYPLLLSVKGGAGFRRFLRFFSLVKEKDIDPPLFLPLPQEAIQGGGSASSPGPGQGQDKTGAAGFGVSGFFGEQGD
jgi:hypothetical protein